MITDFFIGLLVLPLTLIFKIWGSVFGAWTLPEEAFEILDMIGRAIRWWDWLLPIDYIYVLVAVWVSFDVAMFFYDLIRSVINWMRGMSSEPNIDDLAAMESGLPSDQPYRPGSEYSTPAFIRRNRQKSGSWRPTYKRFRTESSFPITKKSVRGGFLGFLKRTGRYRYK